MILVDVEIPCINAVYDFMLEENLPVGQITLEICEIISKQIKNDSLGREELFRLYRKDTKKLLSVNKTLYQLGIKDGFTLLLI